MSGVQRISPFEAGQIIADRDVLVLDIRDFRSYRAGHYPRALHLDSNNLRLLVKHTNRNVPVLIYCQNGKSSVEIAELFVEAGFKNSFSLDGGYQAWLSSFGSFNKPAVRPLQIAV